MNSLLRIDTSPLGDRSYSRRIANAIENALKQSIPQLETINRDLSKAPVPQMRNETIAGFFQTDEVSTETALSATSYSDAAIAQLLDAEILLISAPMYNFGVPASLKAWIDQIVRIGRTFHIEDHKLTGLVPPRHAFLALSYGGSGYLDSSRRHLDYLAPYLETLLEFLGYGEIHTYRLEGTASDGTEVNGALRDLLSYIQNDISSINIST